MGHMISLVATMLVVATISVSILVVAEILLIEKFNRSPVGGPEIIVLTILVVLLFIAAALHHKIHQREL